MLLGRGQPGQRHGRDNRLGGGDAANYTAADCYDEVQYMRSTRWLLLLAILAILGGTGALYRLQRRIVQSRTPPKPASLPLDTNNLAFDYEYAQSTGGQTKFKVRATKFRQVGQTAVFELEGVELELQKEPTHFDLIKSAKAQFDKGEARMFSEGQVEITLDIPRTGQPPHPLTSIQSSGVTFDSKSGKASTDRATSFTFQNGHGNCVGAVYDPNVKELHLLHATDLTLQGSGPHSQPMRVQSEELTYREGGSTITLGPWAKMHRAETDLEAGASRINLKQSALDSIDAEHAHGTDHYPQRQLDYAADTLHMQYSPDGELRQINGQGHARLDSTSNRGRTNMTGNVFNLDFTQQNNEATLAHVHADGNAVVETIPAAADPKAETPETKILRSNTVEIDMRPGGHEIDHVQTHAPGVLEFVPNAPKQHRRLLNGERMTIRYAPQNQIESFESVHVTTQTFPAAAEKNKTAVPSTTASVHMTAAFNPKTGQLTQIKQWENFSYAEGPRRAASVTATLDQEKDAIDLQDHARVRDEIGSTDADHIVLNKKSGDMAADGRVNTSRLPDKKKNSSELLDGDQPTQGQARHMTSANHNKLVHYEGDVLLWQETNRIQGDVIDLNRDKHTLTASGHVVTTFVDQPAKKPSQENAKAPAKTAPEETAFTVVRAPSLLYTETDRLAHYTGGVSFERPGLTVHSAELKAWMNAKDSTEDSKINHAFADGKVEIVESTPVRQRRGTGEHAEYYAAEARILLRGGEPELVDNQKGTTRGAELTYFTNDDRLLVTGDPGKPVKSTVHRKHAVS